MEIEFQVWRDGGVIYQMTFPTEEEWQFGEFSKVAFEDFKKQRPDVSLFDEDVFFRFAKLGE